MKNNLFGYLDITPKHTVFYVNEGEFKLYEKFKKTLQSPGFETNGNRLRQIVNLLAKRFKNSSEQLKNFMRGDFLSAYGADNNYHLKNKSCFDKIDSRIKEFCRSAYIMNTGDFSCLKDSEYAGFAITLKSSPKKIQTESNMFMFARLSGDALSYSTNSDNSLYKSVNSGNSLYRSVNMDKSLAESKNFGNSLSKSQNFDFALNKSKNFEKTLQSSKNYCLSLENSLNFGNSLKKSQNFNCSLNYSYNFENALYASKNYKYSLENASISGSALSKAKNSRV